MAATLKSLGVCGVLLMLQTECATAPIGGFTAIAVMEAGEVAESEPLSTASPQA